MTNLLTTLGDTQEQNLLQLADMLSGDSDTAQQLLDPSSTDPDAPSVTISRRLISDIVGIYQAIRAGFPQMSEELARYKRTRRAAKSSPVMADAGAGSGVQACITITQEQDGNNGCPADWTLSTYTSETSLIIQFTVLGGRGPGFGSGHGTVTTE